MKNDSSTRASALLRKAAGGYEPTRADREKTRAAIARRLAIGVAAGAAVSAGAKSAAAAPSIAPVAGAGAGAAGAGAAIGGATVAGTAGIGFATKIVAAIAIVGTVSAGAVGVQKRNASTVAKSAPVVIDAKPIDPKAEETKVASPIAPSAERMPIEDVAPAVDEAPIATPATAIAPAIANVPQKQADRAIAPKTVESAPTAPQTSLQIAAENALFVRAERALEGNDPERALSLLDEQTRTFPNGTFVEEREAARVLALCAAGREDEARAKADAFVVAYPRSLQASRLRAACVK
ncbi:MAG TPA: hypothetical protein VF407_16175 [Polyangiaceae bacterium]